MTATKMIVTDAEIVSMIERNDTSGWTVLQDKYAAILYGAIQRIVNNEALATAILIKVFVTLKAETATLLNSKRPLCIFLLHYVYEASTKVQDIQQKMPAKENAGNNAYPLLNSLMYRRCSLEDIAEENVLTRQEVQLRLRSELNQFRSSSVAITA